MIECQRLVHGHHTLINTKSPHTPSQARAHLHKTRLQHHILALNPSQHHILTLTRTSQPHILTLTPPHAASHLRILVYVYTTPSQHHFFTYIHHLLHSLHLPRTHVYTQADIIMPCTQIPSCRLMRLFHARQRTPSQCFTSHTTLYMQAHFFIP